MLWTGRFADKTQEGSLPHNLKQRVKGDHVVRAKPDSESAFLLFVWEFFPTTGSRFAPGKGACKALFRILKDDLSTSTIRLEKEIVIKPDSPTLPNHVEQTVQTIAALHLQHRKKASAVHRFIEELTGFVGRPRFAGILTILLALWVGLNLLWHHFGQTPPDVPPFPWVQFIAGLLSVYVTVLVLITQRREYQLEERRAELTLQLAILAEQKNAKIIQMLDDLRRDHPEIQDRVDDDAKAMSTPADPAVVVEATNSSQG
jgi:uncharacterized membrane protein